MIRGQSRIHINLQQLLLLPTGPAKPRGGHASHFAGVRKRMFQALVFILSIFCTFPAYARDKSACSSLVLKADQRWNPDDADVTPKLHRFYELDDLLEAAVKEGNTPSTRELAGEYLSLANDFPCNWNYGNAIHDANSALGMLAIIDGDIDSAKRYLLAAGKSPGSPQLDTFGPSLELAQELLKRRELPTVASYFESVARFWKMDQGVIRTWLTQLSQKEIPDVARHCRKGI